MVFLFLGKMYHLSTLCNFETFCVGATEKTVLINRNKYASGKLKGINHPLHVENLNIRSKLN